MIPEARTTHCTEKKLMLEHGNTEHTVMKLPPVLLWTKVQTVEKHSMYRRPKRLFKKLL